MVNKAIAAIEEQQKKVKERSAQWMVGEQLKDICQREPKSAEIILQDLAVKEMSITEAEKEIKAFADKNKVGNCACVTPVEAERILREFYGLSEQTGGEIPTEHEEGNRENERENSSARKVIDLDAFF